MKYLIYVLLCLSPIIGYGQQNTHRHYYIFLKEKANVTSRLSNPSGFLSARSIARKQRQGIPIQASDVPISKDRIEQIRTKVHEYVGHSKWFNLVHVFMTEVEKTEVEKLDFVDRVESQERKSSLQTAPNLGQPKWQPTRAITPRILPDSKSKTSVDKYEPSQYGSLFYKNLTTINADALHKRGFTGKGVLVGVMDANFYGVNEHGAFETLRNENRIVDHYDYVHQTDDMYTVNSNSTHGSGVLSLISSEEPGKAIGTAYEADVAIYQTEDGARETLRENTYWMQAIERADSTGVDVVNTSLGYNQFDIEESVNYSFELSHIDGKTAYMSRAATLASNKGIVVVVSAGNSGESSRWPKITVPSDAESILTIGAIDYDKIPVGFSSNGPTADGRIKPEALAVGNDVIIAQGADRYSASSGTSFSSPIIAGVVACVIQANPNLKPSQIIDVIKKSGSTYSNPTDKSGYGIPNFETVLSEVSEGGSLAPSAVSLSPSVISEGDGGRKIGTLAPADPSTGSTYTYKIVIPDNADPDVCNPYINSHFSIKNDELHLEKALFHSSIKEDYNLYRLWIEMTDNDGNTTVGSVIVTIGAEKGKHQESSKVSIYPNPVENELWIRTTNTWEGEWTYTLYDSSGKLLTSQQLTKGEGATDYLVSTTSLPRGQYILQVQTPSQNYSFGLVK